MSLAENRRPTGASPIIIAVLTLVLTSTSAFAQDSPQDSAKDASSQAQTSPQDAEQETVAKLQSLFEDFLHYARLGKFTEARAQAEELLDDPDLTPLRMLAIADKDADAVPALLRLIQHTSLNDQAQRILDLIRQGEFERRKMPERIAKNIQELGGPPQMEFFAIQRLRESGEYAVPYMIDALLDPGRQQLWPRIIRALPQLGKSAVAPLVQALQVDDPDVRRNIIWALGELGYPQAVPYLLELASKESTEQQTQEAIVDALQRIQQTSDRRPAVSPVPALLSLADQYYYSEGSVAADPRVPTANVWYWRDGRLMAIEVPTEIHDPIMAMRTAAAALQIEPDNAEAIALWLAANFRREARLGMDVESTEPDAGADADATRPENFPRSIYFARAAGPLYDHMVLGRAIHDQDKPVALGAIAALSVVAGESSLVGSEDYKQPLVEALEFPDSEVRIKAAIALARALPRQQFDGADRVGVVLAEALRQGGEPQYVVVSEDQDNLNRLAGELRESGATVLSGSNFLAAMQRARSELPDINGVFISTGVENPSVVASIQQLRSESRFRRLPVVILAKRGEEHRAEQAAMGDDATAVVDALASGADLRDAVQGIAEKEGKQPLSADLAAKLALQSAEALRLVATDGRTVIGFAPAVPALISALGTDDQDLRIAAAHVLALWPAANAQQAIAHLALDDINPAPLRIAAFDALAESARRNGNMLDSEQVNRVVQAASATADLTLRTAASQALGALNLQVNEASEIIRSYYRG